MMRAVIVVAAILIAWSATADPAKDALRSQAVKEDYDNCMAEWPYRVHPAHWTEDEVIHNCYRRALEVLQ